MTKVDRPAPPHGSFRVTTRLVDRLGSETPMGLVPLRVHSAELLPLARVVSMTSYRPSLRYRSVAFLPRDAMQARPMSSCGVCPPLPPHGHI